jgi:hypothetical protein
MSAKKPRKSASMAELKEMIRQAREAVNAMKPGRQRDLRAARLDVEEARIFGARTISNPSQLAPKA